MRASKVIGAAAWLAAIGSPALAQEAGDGGLTLLCQGSQILQIPAPSYGYAYGYGYGTYREVRQGAQLVVVVDGGQVRVRPPELAVPVYAKRSEDGWYVLSNPKVDKFTIRGRANFSRIDRDRLNVDRRSGAVTFGTFTGVCNRVANGADATRF